MTKQVNPTNDTKINVHNLLQRRGQVAVIWSTKDVKAVCPDLTDGQAWQVLRQCRRVLDNSRLFKWQLIECVAESLFPESGE